MSERALTLTLANEWSGAHAVRSCGCSKHSAGFQEEELLLCLSEILQLSSTLVYTGSLQSARTHRNGEQIPREKIARNPRIVTTPDS